MFPLRLEFHVRRYLNHESKHRLKLFLMYHQFLLKKKEKMSTLFCKTQKQTRTMKREWDQAQLDPSLVLHPWPKHSNAWVLDSDLSLNPGHDTYKCYDLMQSAVIPKALFSHLKNVNDNNYLIRLFRNSWRCCLLSASHGPCDTDVLIPC